LSRGAGGDQYANRRTRMREEDWAAITP